MLEVTLKITSVTVTYNPDIFVLREQFCSLVDQVSSLLVVDNGSTNRKDVELLCNEYNAVFIRLDENKGLAYAQNLGIVTACGDGATHIVLFDQDSILGDKFVSNLYEVYVNTDVDVLGSVFYDPKTNDFYKGTNYFGPFIKTEKISYLTEVTYVIASGSFFSVDVFEKVGPMREELFVDYIDVEWSLRAQSLGLKVCMTNRANMSHTIGDSRMSFLGRKISIHSPIRRYFLVRNSFFMIRCPYVPLGYKIREIFLNLIRTSISIFVSKEKLLTTSVALKGVKDGIVGRFGPYR